jgi:hypothetical protein
MVCRSDFGSTSRIGREEGKEFIVVRPDQKFVIV